MAINKEWHEKNKMAKNASIKEKIKWHLSHEKNCSCRAMPQNIREAMKKMQIAKK